MVNSFLGVWISSHLKRFRSKELGPELFFEKTEYIRHRREDQIQVRNIEKKSTRWLSN